MSSISDLEHRAHAFAMGAHRDQKRKYTNVPYITHPEAVAELVRSVPHTEEMLAAAWLHDVVEDCGVDLSDITARFGEIVSGLVSWLTDPVMEGTRAERKAKVLTRLAFAPAGAQTIKLADLIDNGRSIVEHDPAFSRVYLAEKTALLAVLTKGAEELRLIAYEVLERGLEALKDVEFTDRVRAALHLVEKRIEQRANPARMGIENLLQIESVLRETLLRHGVKLRP